MKYALFICAVLSGSPAFASGLEGRPLISALARELPSGFYSGKGYKFPCTVEVKSDSQSYSLEVRLDGGRSGNKIGTFYANAASKSHPSFESPNYVGNPQALGGARVFVVTSDGYRLIIYNDGRIKAGKLTGSEVTCGINIKF